MSGLLGAIAWPLDVLFEDEYLSTPCFTVFMSNSEGYLTNGYFLQATVQGSRLLTLCSYVKDTPTKCAFHYNGSGEFFVKPSSDKPSKIVSMGTYNVHGNIVILYNQSENLPKVENLRNHGGFMFGYKKGPQPYNVLIISRKILRGTVKGKFTFDKIDDSMDWFLDWAFYTCKINLFRNYSDSYDMKVLNYMHGKKDVFNRNELFGNKKEIVDSLFMKLKAGANQVEDVDEDDENTMADVPLNLDDVVDEASEAAGSASPFEAYLHDMHQLFLESSGSSSSSDFVAVDSVRDRRLSFEPSKTVGPSCEKNCKANDKNLFKGDP